MINENRFGVIREDLYSLGPAELPVLFLDCEKPAFFEAGVSMLAPYYLDKAGMLLAGRDPAYLFITHVHFDHCGSAGHFKRSYPKIQIAASREASEIIVKPSAIELIGSLNSSSHDNATRFVPFEVDRVLNDEEIIGLSPRHHVEVIKTPGHTRDMLSYYIPEYRVMIPSETIGVLSDNNYIFSEFLIDYDVYVQSITKLMKYDIDVMVMAHGVYLTGKECRDHLTSSLDFCERFLTLITDLISKYGDDIEAIMHKVQEHEYDILSENKQPREAYRLNLRAKINAVMRRRIKVN